MRNKNTLHCLLSLLAVCAFSLSSGIASAVELKLVRYGDMGSEKPGLIDAQGQIRDLSGHIDDLTPDMLSDASLEMIDAIPLSELPIVSGDPRLGVPLTGISKILAVGFNYIDHAAEMATELPTEPLIFMKAISSLNGPFDNIVQPRGGFKLDYESELVVVIGKKAQYVDIENAFDYIAGYSSGHDVSERAFQRERGGQFVKGKSADTFGPLGPWLVTRDSIEDIQNLSIWSEVNGEMRQQGNTTDMVFGVAHIVSYISQFMTLNPGDVIFTGAPAGVGDGMTPPVYLKPGDVVRVGIDGLSSQQQTVLPPPR